MGIEPTLAAWEAAVLPLNYTRVYYEIIPALHGEIFHDLNPPTPGKICREQILAALAAYRVQ